MLSRTWRPLSRAPYLKPFSLSPVQYRVAICRYNSTDKTLVNPSTIPPSNASPTQVPPVDTSSKAPQRFEKLLNKTPEFMRNWLQPIANAPLSHITAFLILHEVTSPGTLAKFEVTAIVPLIGLTYIFHKAQWTPQIFPGEWLVEGVEKGAKIIRHYGINVKGEQFVRLAFEFAAAYASVKVNIS